MKKVILAIAIILTATAAGFSQNTDSSAVMYRLDSIIIEREGLQSSKETYLYNEHGKEILITRSSWDETNNEWSKDVDVIEYVYDTNKNLITVIDHFGDTWKTKNEWIYDTNKNVTTHIKSYRNDSIDDWKNSTIIEYVYNANNKLSQVQSQSFSFRIKGKVEYQYNDNGDTIMEIGYEGNMVDETWKEKYIREYVYDTSGNKIKEICYFWRKNAWKIYSKEESVYNTGKIIERVCYSSWEKNVLRKSCKDEYEYDKKMNTKTWTHYLWKKNTWIKQRKYECVYNNSGKEIISQEYYWDKNNNNWFMRSKTEMDYDANGNEIMYRHYYQNWGGNGLKPWIRNEYIYDLSYSRKNLIMPQWCYHSESLEENTNLDIEYRFYSGDDEKPHNVTKILLFTSICENQQITK